MVRVLGCWNLVHSFSTDHCRTYAIIIIIVRTTFYIGTIINITRITIGLLTSNNNIVGAVGGSLNLKLLLHEQHAKSTCYCLALSHISCLGFTLLYWLPSWFGLGCRDDSSLNWIVIETKWAWIFYFICTSSSSSFLCYYSSYGHIDIINSFRNKLWWLRWSLFSIDAHHFK